MSHAETSKINTWEIRGAGGSDQREVVGGGKARVESTSSDSGNQSERIPGEIGAWGASFVSGDVAGKIVDELIAAQEKRAQESQECIKWYQREYEFAMQKIEDLKGLKLLISEETESTESANQE